MKLYRADLHIHTVLSPCGNLEMSPSNIINKAVEQSLDIIGVTDHNSTLHGPLMRKLGKQQNVFVMTGAEVTTREEVHCLAFFENDEMLGIFQGYLDRHLPVIKNKPSVFGYQVVVDENENILKQIEPLLITGIRQSIDEVERMVHQLNGIFIPAHVNKKVNSILGNLGFLPADLKADAMEVTGDLDAFLRSYPEFDKFSIVKSSDAHQPELIGKRITLFELDHPDFNEVKMALCRVNNRRIVHQ